jgi:hypothetical protein
LRALGFGLAAADVERGVDGEALRVTIGASPGILVGERPHVTTRRKINAL